MPVASAVRGFLKTFMFVVPFGYGVVTVSKSSRV